MRVGAVTDSEHAIKAKNVHIAANKNKIRITLFTSKTHGWGSHPQEIKISSREATGKFMGGTHSIENFFCPFVTIRRYMNMRGSYYSDNENFFIFRDGTPVTHTQA